MNNIDTSKWKWFRIGDIFPPLKIKKYSSEPEEQGLLPYITSTSNNNGVNSLVNELESFNKKCLTISTNGKCFDVFLQDYGKFCISSDVEILFNENLTNNQYLFISTVIKLDQYRWGYGRKPKNNKVFDTKIKLPSKENEPDWEYMEQYIKSLRERERENSQLAESYLQLEKKSQLDIVNWKQFKIGELFEVSRGKRIVRDIDYFKDKTNEFNIPVITSTTLNNSVDGYYNKYNCEGNVICCGGEASGMFSTYQEEKCWVMDRSRILNPKFKMSKNIALFLVSILNLNQYKFSYGRSANPEDINDIIITLPIDNNNNINFKYMEDFIRERERGIQTPLWSIFKIEDIFEIKNGYGITKEDIELCQGNIPAIQGGDENNGILGFLKENLNFLFINEPCLTLARVGSAGALNLFQNGCYIGDKAKALLLKPNFEKYKNIFIYSFLKTIINQNKYRYSYGRGVITNEYYNLNFILPIDDLGNPNWEYMEQYIKSLPYSKYL